MKDDRKTRVRPERCTKEGRAGRIVSAALDVLDAVLDILLSVLD